MYRTRDNNICKPLGFVFLGTAQSVLIVGKYDGETYTTTCIWHDIMYAYKKLYEVDAFSDENLRRKRKIHFKVL